MNIKEKIEQLVIEKLALTENFLVEVKVSTNKIIVIIDHQKAVKIEDCVAINRYLHDKLDDENVFEKTKRYAS